MQCHFPRGIATLRKYISLCWLYYVYICNCMLQRVEITRIYSQDFFERICWKLESCLSCNCTYLPFALTHFSVVFMKYERLRAFSQQNSEKQTSLHNKEKIAYSSASFGYKRLKILSDFDWQSFRVNWRTSKHTKMSLAGRICVVTGASKGIGRGIALQLGGNGATVYITGRSKDKLDSCADEIKKRGGEVRNFLEYYVKWLIKRLSCDYQICWIKYK